MKKLLNTILAMSMMLALVSCSSGTTSTSSTTSTTTTTTTSTTEAAADDSSDSGIAVPSSPLRYSLGSGSSGGNFYVVGAGISTMLNNELGDYFTITSEETGGSTANLTMIQAGEAELGITMCSSIADALAGTADWTGGESLDKIRGMVPLYPSYMTVYTLADSGIETLDDITGTIAGLGSKGAAMDSVFRDSLPAMGIEPASIFNDGHSATASAVSDGQVDVAILFSYPPFSSITELEASKSVRFIGLTEEQQDYMTSTYSFYSASTMPAGSYTGVTEDIPTVSEWNMLVCSSDLSEDYAYLLTKTILENNDYLLDVYSGLEYCVADNMESFNVYLHAGTVRYLVEIGVDVPDSLIPPEYNG